MGGFTTRRSGDISWRTRAEARKLYAIKGFTLEQIAEALNVSYSVVRKWKKELAWDEARDGYLAGEAAVLNVIRQIRDKVEAGRADQKDHVTLLNAVKFIEEKYTEPPLVNSEKLELIEQILDVIRNVTSDKTHDKIVSSKEFHSFVLEIGGNAARKK